MIALNWGELKQHTCCFFKKSTPCKHTSKHKNSNTDQSRQLQKEKNQTNSVSNSFKITKQNIPFSPCAQFPITFIIKVIASATLVTLVAAIAFSKGSWTPWIQGGLEQPYSKKKGGGCTQQSGTKCGVGSHRTCSHFFWLIVHILTILDKNTVFWRVATKESLI